MLYFANPSTSPIAEAMSAAGSGRNGGGVFGCITTPAQPNRVPHGAWWCADNGCFGQGYPGDVGWYTWLWQLRERADMDKCLFATAPDVVGDAKATIERSAPWLPLIRELGYPAAYVLQDGHEAFSPPWADFDAAFVGGSTEFKMGGVARALVLEAKTRGKWVHMGRVNSLLRLTYATVLGCDSVDGTYLRFGPVRNLARMGRWLGQAEELAGEIGSRIEGRVEIAQIS